LRRDDGEMTVAMLDLPLEPRQKDG